MTYRITLFLMTLSELQGNSPIASRLKRDFHTNIKQLTRFQMTMRVTRSHTEIAELLVVDK